MAGTLKTNAVQLGDSATATQNLTIRTNADGSFTLARGNVGATTQDILTIDANGGVAAPQSVVAFAAYATVATAANGFARITLDTEEYDTRSRFNNTSAVVNGIPPYAFMPDVPGYYQINGSCQFSAASGTEIGTCFYKNGLLYKLGMDVVLNGAAAPVASAVYLNGTTDYVQLYGYAGAALNTSTGIGRVWFNGVLLARA